ncbi:unnamed protein product [Rotaria sp. Silwood2]|nr:unnamed protein product [Rotaria sp. Silwood2]CAF3041737.1 unnamed protein product [Rotaria sp. Silwood2]CAF3378120.1 unnamed protein product [Rotaria sp. Silwood2]CAF4443184.1 unnamed protein product [Rotaria sp. Silwood2]CAF4470219.1 unnamed protein product [Rotaria sp. Silwood2]
MRLYILVSYDKKILLKVVKKKINEKQKKLDEDLKNKTIDETTAEQKTEEIAGLVIIQSGQEAFLTLLQSEKDSKIKRLDKNKENAIHDYDEPAGNLANTTHHHQYDAHEK